MPDSTYSILIKYGLDDAAAKAAVQDLNQLSQGTEAAGKQTKLAVLHNKEFKKVISELSREFPIAGLAMRAFASPIGATLSIATALFVAFKRNIEETNARLDEFGANAAQPLDNFAEAMRQAKNEATAAHGAFTTALEAIISRSGLVSEKADAAVASIRRLLTAQLELNNAAQARAIAQVNLNEQTGRISSVQAIDQRRQINDFYARQEQQRRDLSAKAEADKRNQEIFNLERQREAVAARIPAGDETTRAAVIKKLTQTEASANEQAKKLGSSKTGDEKTPIGVLWARVDALEKERAQMPDTADLAVLRNETMPRLIAAAVEEVNKLTRLRDNYILASQKASADIARLQNEAKALDAGRAELKRLDEDLRKKRAELAESEKARTVETETRGQKGDIDADTRRIEAEAARQRAAEADRKRQEQENARRAREGQRTVEGGQTGAPTVDTSTIASAGDELKDAITQMTNATVAAITGAKLAVNDGISRINDAANA